MSDDRFTLPDNRLQAMPKNLPNRMQYGMQLTLLSAILVLTYHSGKLVQAEETAIGNIGISTYAAYIRAAGGWLAVLGVVFLYFLCASSLVFSDYWLTAWIGSYAKVLHRNNRVRACSQIFKMTLSKRIKYSIKK